MCRSGDIDSADSAVAKRLAGAADGIGKDPASGVAAVVYSHNQISDIDKSISI